MLAALIRAFLAFVFLFAGITKLFDLATFAHVVGEYHVVPSVAVEAVARTVPFLEIIVGLLILFVENNSRFVLIAILILSLFCGVAVSGLITHRVKECGCFGRAFSRDSAWNVVLLDGMLIVAAFYLYYRMSKREGQNRPRDLAAR